MEIIFESFNIFTYISVIGLITFLVFLCIDYGKYKLRMWLIDLFFTIIVLLDSFNVIKIGLVPNLIILIFTALLPIVNILAAVFGLNLEEYILIFLVNMYIGTKKQKKAKNILNKYLEKNPDSYIAHREIANIYKIEGGMRKAIEEYVKAIEINRKDYKSLYEVTRLLEDLDKSSEAEELLRHLIKVKEDYIEAYILLADILESSDRNKEAAAIYEEGVKNNPMSYELTYNLAAEYTELRSLDKAELTFKRALELVPENYICIYHLAQLNYIFGNLKEAEEMFTKTLEHPALEANSYFELAKIAKLLGRREKAILYLNNSLSLNNDLLSRLNEEEIFKDIKEETIVSVNMNDKKEDYLDILKPRTLKVIALLENTANLINNIAFNTRKENTETLVDEMIASNLKIDKSSLKEMKEKNSIDIKEKIENIEKIVDKYIKEDRFLNIEISDVDGKHDEESKRTPYISALKKSSKPYDISYDQRIKNIEESYNENKLELMPDRYRVELENKIKEKRANIKSLKEDEDNEEKKEKQKQSKEEKDNLDEKSILEDILDAKKEKEEKENNIEINNEEILRLEQEKIEEAKKHVFNMLERIKKEKKANTKIIENDKIKEEDMFKRNKRRKNKQNKKNKQEDLKKYNEEDIMKKEEIKENKEKKENEKSLNKAGEFYANYKGYGYKSSSFLGDEKKTKNEEDSKKKVEYLSDEIEKESKSKKDEIKTEELYRNMLLSNLMRVKKQTEENKKNEENSKKVETQKKKENIEKKEEKNKK